MNETLEPDNSTVDPITFIERDHVLQFKLCDVLEAIADGLPEHVDPALVKFAVPILRNDLRTHMKLEDDILFPLLRKYTDARPGLTEILDQLTHEHEIDESYGDELADHLEDLQSDRSEADPNMIGYMLRGFFETQRRHIEWENTVVLPLAREVLTPDDLTKLRRETIESEPVAG